MADTNRKHFNLSIIKGESGLPHRVEATYTDKDGREKFVLTDTANHLVGMVVRLLEKLNILDEEVKRLKPLALNGIVLARFLRKVENVYIEKIKEVMPLKELIQTKPLTEAYAAGLTKAIEVIESIRK